MNFIHAILREMLLLLFHFFNNSETIITEKQSLYKAIKPLASSFTILFNFYLCRVSQVFLFPFLKCHYILLNFDIDRLLVIFFF